MKEEICIINTYGKEEWIVQNRISNQNCSTLKKKENNNVHISTFTSQTLRTYKISKKCFKEIKTIHNTGISTKPLTIDLF